MIEILRYMPISINKLQLIREKSLIWATQRYTVSINNIIYLYKYYIFFS